MRCAWAESDKLFIPYHDNEWGVPVHDDHTLFEMINLEGAQAGLSWLTILRKRDSYRAAFDNFNAKIIAEYDEAKRATLMQDGGIIRNRLKINAAIENAKSLLHVQHEFGSFSAYLWQFVDNTPIVGGELNGGAAASERLSKDLKKRGFKFVGPTICYAFMQAVGMIDDHEVGCFRHSATSVAKAS